jgi:hypothetical protein
LLALKKFIVRMNKRLLDERIKAQGILATIVRSMCKQFIKKEESKKTIRMFINKLKKAEFEVQLREYKNRAHRNRGLSVYNVRANRLWRERSCM